MQPLLLTFLDPITKQTLTIPLGEQAAITMNARTIRTDVLIRPNLLITSGDEHEIFAGDNIPIPVSQSAGGAAAIAQSPSLTTRKNIERQDVGTYLRLTPTVGEQGGVTLELNLEVSSLAESVAGDVEKVGPTISQVNVESIALDAGRAGTVCMRLDRPFGSGSQQPR